MKYVSMGIILCLCIMYSVDLFSEDVQPSSVKSSLPVGANFQQSNFYDPLIIATSTNNKEKVLEFLKNGADPNKIYFGTFTPILAAARSGNIEIVTILLKYGANIELVNGLGSTPLMMAVAEKNPKAVKILIEKGANVNFHSIYNGGTPLDLAKMDNDKEMIGILLNAGAVQGNKQ